MAFGLPAFSGVSIRLRGVSQATTTDMIHLSKFDNNLSDINSRSPLLSQLLMMNKHDSLPPSIGLTSFQGFDKIGRCLSDASQSGHAKIIFVVPSATPQVPKKKHLPNREATHRKFCATISSTEYCAKITFMSLFPSVK
jgi:hypothetical protein